MLFCTIVSIKFGLKKLSWIFAIRISVLQVLQRLRISLFGINNEYFSLNLVNLQIESPLLTKKLKQCPCNQNANQMRIDLHSKCASDAHSKCAPDAQGIQQAKMRIFAAHLMRWLFLSALFKTAFFGIF